MHDPMTVAFEIKYPWKNGRLTDLFPKGYRDPFITIWHVDPEKDGSDDSCWRGKPSGWRGWRWHFWHWSFQCHPLQNLKRWLFSRCCRCGKGFSWGYAPSSDSWDDDGPRWFRGERGVHHHNCTNPTSNGANQA